MELNEGDLALLSRFFGKKPVKSISIFYERRIFSKIRISMTYIGHPRKTAITN
jgi:hypothetical protein